MRNFGWLILLAWATAGCSGGVELSGDGTDGGDVPAEAVDTADVPGELPSDVTDVPADEASADEASADEGTSDASEDGGALCAPQDARADGPCAAELPGIVWDGTHCRSLGSGCSCVGEDCDEVYDTWTECVTARSSCYGATCEPQEAAGRMCDGGGCAIVLGSFWDGRACFDAIGCECAGADCAAGFASPEECVAVHAGCDGSLCGDTGGQWFPAAAGFCGFSCGVANPITCESPFDSCRCEAGRTFLPGSGCVEEVAGCDAALLCQATEGEWNPGGACPFVCGEELPECYACGDQCNCGPYRRFDADLGCVPEPTCAGTDRAAVCTSTGGTWHDCSPGDPWCSCGDYSCGRPNLTEPCVMPGCDCGWFRNFDPERGCLYDESCVRLDDGESCMGLGLCRAGLVCCEGCGAPPGCATCRAPCCPDDPSCMTDGCPVPPP